MYKIINLITFFFYIKKMYHLQKKAFEDDIISIKNRLLSIEIENNKLKERTNTQEDENTKLKQRVNALEEELESYKNKNEAWKEEEEEGYDEINEKIISIINTNNKLTRDINVYKEKYLDWKTNIRDDIKGRIDKKIDDKLKEFYWTDDMISKFECKLEGTVNDIEQKINREIEKISKYQNTENWKLGKEINEIKENQKKQNKKISEGIKTFATKEAIDEIKNVTIANKRNIIAVASIWAQFLPAANIYKYDVLNLSKMINKRRKEIRDYIYTHMYKGQLKYKSLDELRKIASENNISEVDILDAIESPDDKEDKNGYEGDMDEEYVKQNKKEKSKNKKTSHDNLRCLIIDKHIKELIYPKDQYRYRKIDDLERTFIYKKNILGMDEDIKKISEKLDSAEINRYPNSYNEGFTQEGGYDDY